MCGARVRKCVASLGAAAAARPRRADGKTNRGPARVFCVCVYVCVYTCVWLYLHRAGATLAVTTRKGWRFYRLSSNVRAVLFIRSTHSLSCRGWHCVSGDLTRTFLPPSFRVVVCLRWCCSLYISSGTRNYDSISTPKPAQSRRNLTKYPTCIKSPFFSFFLSA